ncbi:hypothetical protein PUN28_011252 [Cardiocondyla obscurior]|uniref:Uncharacterized protein n=1 Tax=Cardiocondyla obscurior TaxID=286306 RepID=A0AAW2FPJ4_9HYME
MTNSGLRAIYFKYNRSIHWPICYGRFRRGETREAYESFSPRFPYVEKGRDRREVQSVQYSCGQKRRVSRRPENIIPLKGLTFSIVAKDDFAKALSPLWINKSFTRLFFFFFLANLSVNRTILTREFVEFVPPVARVRAERGKKKKKREREKKKTAVEVGYHSLTEIVSAYVDYVVTVISFHDGQKERSFCGVRSLARERHRKSSRKRCAPLRNISL